MIHLLELLSLFLYNELGGAVELERHDMQHYNCSDDSFSRENPALALVTCEVKHNYTKSFDQILDGEKYVRCTLCNALYRLIIYMY